MYAEDWPVRDFLKGSKGDKLLRNDNGKFTTVTRTAGIYGSPHRIRVGHHRRRCERRSLARFIRFQNDFFERDYLYINQKDGTLSKEIEQWISHMSHASMGADMADINNRRIPRNFSITEMLPGDETRLKTTTLLKLQYLSTQTGSAVFTIQYMQNCLQLNNKDKTFSEIAFFSSVAATDWLGAP